jgi:hypothetical protein
VRNPELALKWAEKANAMTGGKHPAILDTLAVALAATGDFGKAIMVVEQGIKLSNESEAAPMRERLALFQKGQPYREPLPVKK